VPGAHVSANTVVDASLAWHDPLGTRMTATLYAKNLFDTNYETGGVPLAAALEVNAIFHGAPRVIGLSLNVPFGAE